MRTADARLIRDRVVCLECEAVHTRHALLKGEVAECSRCHATLGRAHWLDVSRVCALAVAGLIVLVIANLTPIVTLNLRGYRNDATLWGAIVASWQAGQVVVAMIVAATALLAPFMLLALRVYVAGPLLFGVIVPGFGRILRWLGWVQRWNMVEVFMLGVLVALVRLAGIATLKAGPALVAFGVLTVLIAAIESGGVRRWWERADTALQTWRDKEAA